MDSRLRGIGIIGLCLAITASLAAVSTAQVPTFITAWGTYGTGDGQFANVQAVAVGPAGSVYVLDSGGGVNNESPRVERFTSDGTYIMQWGSKGSGNGQFSIPAGVAVDRGGNVYVADYLNFRIQRFTSGGIYLTQWGTRGSGNGQFDGPWGVAVDAGGTVCVSDVQNCRIEVFTSGGEYLAQWGSLGSAAGQFSHPWGIALDGSGDIYVADGDNFRIQKFGSVPTPAKRTTWGRLKGLYR